MNILQCERAIIRKRYGRISIAIMVNGLVVDYVEVISIFPVIAQSEIDGAHVG